MKDAALEAYLNHNDSNFFNSEQLAYFPMMYPDEDLVSVVLRYKLHTGIKYMTYVMKYLFNVPTSIMPAFSCNLHYFLQKLARYNIKINDLFLNHTYYPLIGSFYKKNERDELIRIMLFKGRISYISKKSYISHFLSESIQYCPMCIAEDIVNYGESYIHRSHQVKGMGFCHKHGTALRHTCPICNGSVVNRKNSYRFFEGKCYAGHDLKQKTDDNIHNYPHYNLRYKIAKDIYFILNNNKYSAGDIFNHYNSFHREMRKVFIGGLLYNDKYRPFLCSFHKSYTYLIYDILTMLSYASSVKIFMETPVDELVENKLDTVWLNKIFNRQPYLIVH